MAFVFGWMSVPSMAIVNNNEFINLGLNGGGQFKCDKMSVWFIPRLIKVENFSVNRFHRLIHLIDNLFRIFSYSLYLSIYLLGNFSWWYLYSENWCGFDKNERWIVCGLWCVCVCIALVLGFWSGIWSHASQNYVHLCRRIRVWLRRYMVRFCHCFGASASVYKCVCKFQDRQSSMSVHAYMFCLKFVVSFPFVFHPHFSWFSLSKTPYFSTHTNAC